jgi:CheY-like chemotaxis protein/HPt (histidine-containing phosphotransfer) domain-containing protein
VPHALSGDPARLRQVLLNLLGNAIKFTDAGFVQVEVEPGSAKGVDGGFPLRVSVRDSGIGIAEDALPLLFQEFIQVDRSATRRFGGTGLGLAISRRIIEAMGGTIGVESRLGRGSTFWFDVALPLAETASLPEPAPEPGSVAAKMRPLRILVAEDNALNQQVALGLLGREGHAVEIAADGREAVEAVRIGHYDVVLMDVHMPELDGMAATREIRRLGGERGRVPIIALSASVLPSETEHCLAAGMDAHLPKPIDPRALAEALARHTAGRLPTLRDADARQVLDRAHLELLLGALGRGRVEALIEALPEDAAPHRQRLAATSSQGDREATRRAAHALKGIAANLGLLALADLTGAIEEACAEGQDAVADRLCRSVEAVWQESYTELRRLPG